MARDRKGAQLALEVDPQLLERLRARAAADGRPLAALVRRWLEAGLSGALEQQAAPAGPDLADLAARVGWLEAELAQLRRPRPPITSKSSSSPASPDRVIPAPLVGEVPPGGIENAKLAELLGMRRGTLNARIARAGGAAPGLVVEGWRCLGARVPARGGPARALWEPA
jgi:plasmid stability protein